MCIIKRRSEACVCNYQQMSSPLFTPLADDDAPANNPVRSGPLALAESLLNNNQGPSNLRMRTKRGRRDEVGFEVLGANVGHDSCLGKTEKNAPPGKVTPFFARRPTPALTFVCVHFREAIVCCCTCNNLETQRTGTQIFPQTQTHIHTRTNTDARTYTERGFRLATRSV